MTMTVTLMSLLVSFVFRDQSTPNITYLPSVYYTVRYPISSSTVSRRYLPVYHLWSPKHPVYQKQRWWVETVTSHSRRYRLCRYFPISTQGCCDDKCLSTSPGLNWVSGGIKRLETQCTITWDSSFFFTLYLTTPHPTPYKYLKLSYQLLLQRHFHWTHF